MSLQFIEKIIDSVRGEISGNKVVEPGNYSYRNIAQGFLDNAKVGWYGVNLQPNPATLSPYRVNFQHCRLDMEGLSAGQINQRVTASLFDAYKEILPPIALGFDYQIAGESGLERVSYYHSVEEAKQYGVGLHEAGFNLQVVLFPPGFKPEQGYTRWSAGIYFKSEQVFPAAVSEIRLVKIGEIGQGLERDDLASQRRFRRILVQDAAYWEAVAPPKK